MKYAFISFLTIICTILPFSAVAQMVTKTLTDIETGIAVPYAIIFKSDSSVVRYSDADGKFSIEATSGSTYTISHIGYKPITITAEQLLLGNIIKMEMLAYELNPVVVTAETALNSIYRAIDSTCKHIPATPFFQRCYKQDEIVVGNNTVIDAKAIIDIRVSRVRAVGKGALINLSLKGLQIDYGDSGSTDMIPTTSPCPIITFNNGFPQKTEENIVFTRIHSENDSVMIVAFNPKSYYSGDMYPAGRYIIDTRTWSILRIDAILDNWTLGFFNHRTETSNGKRFIHEVNRSIFFSVNGLPSKVEDKIVYSLKTEPDELITYTVVQVYKDISKNEYQQKPSGSYDHKKFILQQKPITIPDFDTKFNLGFQ